MFVCVCVCGGGGNFGLFSDAVAIGDHIIKKVVGIPLAGLTPPHVCACPNTGSGFPTSYVVVFFMFNDLK